MNPLRHRLRSGLAASARRAARDLRAFAVVGTAWAAAAAGLALAYALCALFAAPAAHARVQRPLSTLMSTPLSAPVSTTAVSSAWRVATGPVLITPA
jgi:hypothetical protein